MTAIALRAFPSLGVVSLFEEEPGGGDPISPSAARNAPAASPENYLGRIKQHSALDNFEVVADITVTVHHAAVPAATGGSVGGNTSPVGYSTYTHSTLVYTHGLAFVPYGKVAVGPYVLSGAFPVQPLATGLGRFASAHVTSTGVYIDEFANTTNVILPAIDVDYRIILKAAPRSASGSDLYDFDPVTGVLKLGFDRFSSDRKYLQVVPASEFGLSAGKSIDLANGGPRFINPDGTYFDLPGFFLRLHTDGSFGAETKYNGSSTGSGAILVAVP